MTDKTRKDFLKTVALLGGSAFVATQVPAVFSMLSASVSRAQNFDDYDYNYNNPENTINSVCLQCHVACPMRCKIQNGVLVKIDGNP